MQEAYRAYAAADDACEAGRRGDPVLESERDAAKDRYWAARRAFEAADPETLLGFFLRLTNTDVCDDAAEECGGGHVIDAMISLLLSVNVPLPANSPS